ncbi:MAG: M20/M25/M40 family metallo-hydrolase [Mediterranea massiliensis]|nr:M20/M25/M40 family metallo-hydrolase [Mediterranea massiliensis]
MKRERFTILLFALAGLNMAFAQTSVVKKIIELGTTDNRTMHHLDVLTNRFGGRLVGSDAYENAAEWMQYEYKKWGIESRQEVAGEVSVGFNRGPWFGRLIGGDQSMTLHFATPSYTAGTKGIQRGHVLIEPATEAELNRMKHTLKGAWVLVGGVSSGWPLGHSQKNDSLRAAIKQENKQIALRNDSLRRENYLNGTNHKLQPLRTYPALYYDEMVEAGVLGFIQSSTVPIRALYDRAMLNEIKPTFDELPEVCDIKLDEHQFATIYQMAKERRDFWLEFDIRNHWKLGPIQYNNVVASIPGTKYPDEYVIISGHLDAFDVATGGVDCGTGIAPMMEAARLLALSGAKPKRTILFVAFAAEEFGLLGAQAFVKTHKNKLSKISNLFNRDGGPTPPVGISVPQAMYDDFVKICEPIKNINPDYPFEVRIAQPRKKPTSFGGTDATVFAVEGVPTFGFTESDFKGYNFNYGEIWHTERDLYTKSVPEYMEHTSVVTAIVALGVANLDHQLSRKGMFIE